MRCLLKLSGSLLLCGVLTGFGCRAQSAPQSGETMSPQLARRVELLIRAKSSVPPNYTVHFTPLTASDVPGYRQTLVTFLADGRTSKPSVVLVSNDGKTLAQFSKYDISQDPKQMVSLAGRPARGGGLDAPVDIVVFNDLECPFCAKMHAQLFPALVDRYKGQVRIVYRDFPLTEIHPWAMRAAIDTNCMAAQSSTGYWNMVDYIHAHAAELGGAEKSVAKANEALDTLTRDEGARDKKVDAKELAACVTRQDATPIHASMEAAAALGVDATPAVFINGEKLEGAQPLEDVYRMVDGALTAEGKTPPPAPRTQPESGAAAPAQAKAPAAKPGS